MADSLQKVSAKMTGKTVADSGFPVGGGWGRGPPTRALFGENVCENKRIGSRRGGGVRPARPPRSANAKCWNVKI